MSRRVRLEEVALSDDVRIGLPMTIATVVTLIVAPGTVDRSDPAGLQLFLTVACAAMSVAFLTYLLWTHRVFARMDPERARAVGRTQFYRSRSWWTRTFSFGSAEGWAISVAFIAFLGSLAVSVYGFSGGGAAVTLVALLLAATAWAIVSYTYALRYFRIHAVESSFTFDFTEEPRFTDFLSYALMVSAAGSHVIAVPTSRTGAKALRSHTVIAFVFNALVIAVTVSLIANLVASAGS